MQPRNICLFKAHFPSKIWHRCWETGMASGLQKPFCFRTFCADG